MNDSEDRSIDGDGPPGMEDPAGKGTPGFLRGRSNPYVYVRLAFSNLAMNRFEEARRLLGRASVSGSIIYSEDSDDWKEFSVEMQMLKIVLLFLTDKFRDLPPVE